jgi:hypothetical protein
MLASRASLHPGQGAHAPCTSYLTNAPSSRAASDLSTVPARLRRSHSRAAPPADVRGTAYCVTKQHNGRTRLKAAFVRHIHAQAWSRSPPLRGPWTGPRRVPFWPESSVRSKIVPAPSAQPRCGALGNAAGLEVWGIALLRNRSGARTVLPGGQVAHSTALRTEQNSCLGGYDLADTTVMHSGGSMRRHPAQAAGPGCRVAREICLCSS